MRHRQFITYLITLVFAGLFSCANPASTPSTTYTVSLSGTLVNKIGTQLDSVTFVLWNPFSKDTAKSNGTFSISFQAEDKTTVSDSIIFSRPGFLSTTTYFSYSSTANTINFSAIVLKGVTSAQDSLTTGRPSLRAGEIVYVGSSVPNLSIYGAGGTDEATLTFAVEDSLGNPVDSTNRTLVYFRFATTPPDSFTQLSSSSAKTNSSGTVSVLLGSGLRAGIASVQAYAAVKRAADTTQVDTIASSIASIPIYGGFPDSAHFSMSAAKVNIPGAVQAGISTPITALIGDKYGNPAQPGTIVYFTTTGGIVSPASASSAADGSASVNLISGNPIPAGGIVTVTAELTTGLAGSNQFVLLPKAKTSYSSVGQKPHGKNTALKAKRLSKTEVAFKNQRTVVKFFNETNKVSHSISQKISAAIVRDSDAAAPSKPIQNGSQKRDTTGNKGVTTSSAGAGIFISTVNVVFSGKTTISTPDSNFVIPSHSSKTVNYIVGDLNGNPLTSGSTIQVSVSGSAGVQVTGDVNVTLPDVQDKGFTHYRVIAKDTSTTGSHPTGTVNLNIVVVSPNGSKSLLVNGVLLGGSATDSGKVGKITLVNTATDTVVVNGGGGSSSTQVQFKVYDVFNNPAKNIPINFTLTQRVNGGEYLSPLSAVSDTNGNVSTTFTSGIHSGTVQLVAQAKQDSVNIISSGVKSVYIKTGVIQSIALINASSTSLSVQGAGGNQSSLLIFEGRDSLGNPIDASNATNITFSFQGDTTARISPTIAKTDPATGRVTTSFTSGIKAGTAYITASARADTVNSSPVQISISGGLPDSSHFSITPEKLNIPGGVVSGITDGIDVLVGDEYGNPAQTGSIVYFTTTGGIIQSSATTGTDGKATANLTSGNPVPANGLALITAQIGASNGFMAAKNSMKLMVVRGNKKLNQNSSSSSAAFSRSTTVLLSGKTTISTTDTNFVIPSGGSRIVNYVVGDLNGNPLTSGSTIQVSVSGTSDVALTGNVNVILPDVQDKGFTHYQVIAKDTRTTGLNLTETVNLNIAVVSANGNKNLLVNGRLLGGSATDSGKVGRIALVSTATDTVVVSGGGGSSSKQEQFKVYDVFNQPAKNIPINFTLTQTVNGGEYLSPLSAVSDTNGNVSTTFKSGIRSGTVQLVAQAKQDSANIISSGVKSIYIKTGAIQSIALISVSTQQLSIRSVGGTETASIIFEGRDSLGNAIDASNQTSIKFRVQGDTAGTYVSPNPGLTDPITGRVITTFGSGTTPGVVQVYASAKSDSIKSLPVRFTIASGLPDQAHFTLILPQVNFSSFNTSSSATVTVAAGDTFSNPAQSGTSVYFSTNVGIIGASGTLDGLGNTSVTWAYGLNPQPPSNGIAFVNARTLNRWGKFVQATDTVIFSFGPIIDTLTGPFLNFQIPHGFSQSFTFRVADKNGNPLSKGTTIAVQASGAAAPQVLLSGDVNNILSDTKNAGVGSTIFTVTVSDTTTGTGQGPKPLILTFIVTGPNTSGPVSRSFSGTLQGSSSSGAGKVAQVAVVNPAIDSLTVTGGGGVSSEPIQFQVLDFYSNPIPNVQVQFAISQSVGGGEYFNPTIATSDVNGKVQTTLFAGIRSGLVQVVAKALTVVSNSKSVYIRTGIISSIAIINVSSSSLSVQGVGGNGTSTIVFEGRDSLGNPIDASNSAPIKFTLQGDTSSRVSPLVAKTDPVTGRATTSFTSGIKSGLAYVTASARGDSVKSSPVQFTISGGFPDSTHFSIGPVKLNIAGGAIFGLTDQINLVVGDEYGNPAQPGSVVFFNTTGGIIQASSSLLSDGTASATLTSGNPEPPNGLAIITAQVGASSASAKMGKVARSVPLASRASNTSSTKTAAQSQSFTRSTGVLFSGRTQIASANNNFIIPVGSSTAVNYIVSDSLGNPLVSGTTIQVALSGSGSSNIAMTGDASVNLPDTQDKRYTLFQVSLKDTRTTGLNLSQAVTLTISVNSPNGINKLILTGNLSGTGGITVDSTIVSRIVLQNPSPDSIMVAGVGGVNTDNVKFKVYNTFGLPDKNILVTFNMPQSLGGGEYLSPASALTDTGGNVSTTLTSGTKFGEVLVTASTTEDSISLSSNPKVIYIVIPPSARLASQVLYLGATATDIYVDGVGAIENSTISYQVTDSLGIPIDRQRRVGVTYAVQFFPNSSIAGGTPPSVIPSTDSTDDNGQLHTSVVSGTEAGVIQVVAHINVPGRPTLISQPVKITIHAGFADQAHFTLMPSAYGVAGLNNFIPFTVAVGDTFSNPVAVGTAIYFHSQAGIIQTGSADFSAYTNTTGEAGVSLLLVNPRPLAGTPYEYKPGIGSGLRYADAAHINGRDGYFWVYAQTQGHNATNVIDSALMVWGVGPITVTGLPASVTVSNVTNTSPPISIRVTDGNLNPLPDGTTITASIEPIASPPTGFQVGVSGGISTNFYSTIPYTQNSIFYGTNITDYTFNVVNESVPSNTATGVTVTVVITINAPNIGTASFSFTATMQ